MSLTLKKYPYTSKLGWSVSRYDKFKLCQRQYYYDYYAKNHDNEIDRNELMQLKELTTIPLEIGNIIHDVIKKILERLKKSNSKIDALKLQEFSHNLTNEYCNRKTFSEVFYRELDNIEIEALKIKVESFILSFIESERFKWISETAIETAENWLIEPEGYGETRINDFKAYCKVDFLFPIEDKIYIIDWKTGKEDEFKHRKQMLGYTAFACNHFEKNPEHITCILYYLKNGTEKILTFSKNEIEEFSHVIRFETEEMHAMTSSIEQNIPVGKSEFIQTTNPRICKLCNYRRLCFPNGFNID